MWWTVSKEVYPLRYRNLFVPPLSLGSKVDLYMRVISGEVWVSVCVGVYVRMHTSESVLSATLSIKVCGPSVT